MAKLSYELRYRSGRWEVHLDGLRLFAFERREEAMARLDDLAVVGARGRDVEIVLYDDGDRLVRRYSALDYDI